MISSEWIEDFYGCIADVIDAPSVRSMEKYIQHKDVTTLEHSLSVAFASYVVCRKFHLDFSSAARAGLLHDLFLYDWHKPHRQYGHHGFTHPKTALKNAEREFALSPLERDIILKHMWPLTFRSVPKYRESLVVSCADKVCAGIEVAGLYRKFSDTKAVKEVYSLCKIQ